MPTDPDKQALEELARQGVLPIYPLAHLAHKRLRAHAKQDTTDAG